MRFLEFLDGLEELVGKGRKVPGTKKSIDERDEIAEYVKFFGWTVIKRSKTLTKDETSLEKIGIDTLNQLKSNKNLTYIPSLLDPAR